MAQLLDQLGKSTPVVLTYIDKGLGASILKAGLRLWDGTEVLVPGQFEVEVSPDGDWLLHAEGDPCRPIEGRMPRDGFYFDMPSLTESRPDWAPFPVGSSTAM
mgnify:CR=1 FL=1